MEMKFRTVKFVYIVEFKNSWGEPVKVDNADLKVIDPNDAILKSHGK